VQGVSIVGLHQWSSHSMMFLLKWLQRAARSHPGHQNYSAVDQVLQSQITKKAKVVLQSQITKRPRRFSFCFYNRRRSCPSAAKSAVAILEFTTAATAAIAAGRRSCFFRYRRSGMKNVKNGAGSNRTQANAIISSLR
jgi:hypothetical protein